MGCEPGGRRHGQCGEMLHWPLETCFPTGCSAGPAPGAAPQDPQWELHSSSGSRLWTKLLWVSLLLFVACQVMPNSQLQPFLFCCYPFLPLNSRYLLAAFLNSFPVHIAFPYIHLSCAVPYFLSSFWLFLIHLYSFLWRFWPLWGCF